MRSFEQELEPASYFEEPEELLFDRRLPFNPRLDYILDDNVARYPG